MARSARFLVQLVLGMGLLLSAAAAGQAQTPLKSQLGANKCVDVYGASRAPGAPLVLWDCAGGPNQQFTFGAGGDLRVYDGGLCVDVGGNGTQAGSPVVTWSCRGNPTQKWSRTADGQIRQGATGFCIDASGGASSNGTRLVLWPCNGAANQKWAVNPPAPPIVGQVGDAPAYQPLASVANPARCMDVSGGSMQEGTGVVLWSCHGAANQQIQLRPDGHLAVNGRDGRGYQMCLDYYPARGNNGDRITIWPCHPISNPGDNQRWTRLPSGELRSASGRCIDIQGGRSSADSDGAPLVLWDCPDPDNWNTRRWGDPATARTLAAQYPTRQPQPPASPPPAAQPVRALYVLDGTDSKQEHHNSLWHVYERWNGVGQWWDGPNLMATNIDAIYADAYRAVCRDVRPVSQGGKGVTQVFLAGYSRGAMAALRLANETRANCGARIQFLGLVDAVNTSLVGWPSDIKFRIPYAVHLRKQSDWEHVLTTADIETVSALKAPEAVGHHGMVCAEYKGLTTWAWVTNNLIALAQQAGGSFGPAKRSSTDC